MIELRYGQKVNIGFLYVLGLLSPDSAYGKQALHKLRPFARDQAGQLQRELDNIERTLQARSRCEAEYTKLERVLAQVKDIRQSIERIDGGLLDEVDLFELKRYLLQLAEMAPLLASIQQAAGYEDIELDEAAPALELLDPEKTRVPSFHISGRYSARLTAVRAQKKEVEQRLRNASDDVQRQRLMMERNTCAAEEQLEEEQVCEELTKKLAPYSAALLRNTEVLARLDLTLQKAKMADRMGCCKPVLGGGALLLCDMVNPAVAAALEREGRDFTPVTLELGVGTTVVTGANMGGKSVALKTAALNALLAQCGFYAFAREMQTPLFDAIFMVSEDLEATDRGLSSFGGEIVRLNEITDALPDAFALVLLDEFARGTNPEEGAAIACAVATYLNGKNAVTVMTTHYDGVAGAGRAHYQVAGLSNADMAQLQREVDGASPKDRVAVIARHMDYGLLHVQGDKQVSRDALNVCKLLKCAKEIVDIVENNY